MKIEYYSAVYEDHTFIDYFKSSLADLKLIPDNIPINIFERYHIYYLNYE